MLGLDKQHKIISNRYVSKKFLYFFSFLSLIFFLLLSPNLVYASPEQDVLGDSVDLSIPPTTDGPGFILPDSPFYFLDQIKQTVRLALAFTHEEKARVYSSVAGERLAELRIMLVKKNQDGIQTALDGVSYNFAKAAESVADAQLTGRDVSQLAQNINTDIKVKQDTLDNLENQAGIVLKPRLAAVTQALLGAKVAVEGSLPSGQIASAVKEDVARLIAKDLGSAYALGKNLDREINQLQIQASNSSMTTLTFREDALKKAIALKDKALIKVEQKLLDDDKKKLQTLLSLQAKAAQDVKDATQRLQNATERYQKIQDYVNQLKNTGTASADLLIPTPTK